MELDHVLIAVADLAMAAREIDHEPGLSSIPGGRHAGWGTANRIVPLGNAYLELVAVVDAAEAAHSIFGQWVASVRATRLALLGWCVRTDQLDDVTHRLGLAVNTGSRLAHDGRRLRWRVAGLEQAAAEPSLPFFIEWGPGTPFPGRAVATHRAGPVQLASLRVKGNADRLASWLSPHQLPVTIQPGRPAIISVVLTTDAGEVAIPSGS